MNLETYRLLARTRRQFFHDCGVGVGRIALASLLAESLPAAETSGVNPMAPRQPHFEPKAQSVIYLFMAGAPSQLDLFEEKPKLNELDGQTPPASLTDGKRFAFMENMGEAKLFGSPWKFKSYGQSGARVSELIPQIGSVMDDIAVIKSMRTENFNHAPAKIFAHTGSVIAGRPSMGAWLTYGLGSEATDLPAFVVLQSGPRGPRNGPIIWGSGFLPSTYQATPFMPGPEPIFNLKSQPGVTHERQGRALEAIRKLNEMRLDETGDREIATRIASYEMAYRMQTGGTELTDLSKESEATLEMYGTKPGEASFASNCLLARRLVERGVRCVQLYHTEWDHHQNLVKGLEKSATEVDQPSAALIRDLKQRGLLDQTLVVWGGEFGRTPMAEGGMETIGRNHHIDAYCTWLAGGGVKGGQTIGETDELGFNTVADEVHVHDLHATILHLMGLDHTKLTFRFQGRDFRLTDVAGRLVEKLLA
jgi:hypothetical protein